MYKKIGVKRKFKKKWMIISVVIFSVVEALFLIQGCAIHNGPPSDHFDGVRFYNDEPDNTFWDHVKWLWEMETVEWPDRIVDSEQPPPPARVDGGKLRITHVNHATTLIQMDGINILTDPIWSERAGPFSWAGPKRIRSPGVKMADLPRIDLILISHDHYDHLDLPTLERILESHHPAILAGLGVGKRLEELDCDDVIELDWWDEYKGPSGTVVTFVPSRHNSKRGLLDSNKTLWGGFVIQGKQGAAGKPRTPQTVLFMGDTAYGQCFRKIAEKYPRFNLALLPIGSYEKRWFMKTQHMNPDDAVRAHKLLNAETSIGIHFATFNEHAEQTVDAHEKDLAAALEKHGVPASAFLLLKFGEGKKFVLP